jgi:2'-hydroxyisoflavone reductase
MRILVLGGTSFVGRAIVADALEHGADVTIFTRGRTGTDLFPGVRRALGDRDTGALDALREGSWDAVVDVSAYRSREVNQAMAALGDRVGRYLLISSHAVYTVDGVPAGNDEDTPLRPALLDAKVLSNDTYGPCKVACEEAVVSRYGDRATIVRPGKVAGPYDNQNTFTYWVRTTAAGGRVELPGDPEQPTQIIDSRDLARLVVRLLADDRPGAYNAVGPAEPTTLGGLLSTCARVAGSQIEVVPVAEIPSFPLVRPRSAWTTQQRSSARARAAGMPATALERTAADVLAWDRERGRPPFE